MLILTRRIQEALIINDNVTVTVLSVKGNQVRLGIDAPDDVEVHREEIYHRVKRGDPPPTSRAKPTPKPKFESEAVKYRRKKLSMADNAGNR